MKKFKYLNTICVVMIFSILALAIAIGFVAVSVLKDETPDDAFDGFTGDYQESETVESETVESESESEESSAEELR